MDKKKNKLIGLTGGIGAGKSTVADFFRHAGIPVLSADELAREITQPGEPALREIEEAFGEGALNPNGTLNRPFVRQKILHDQSLKLHLEKITHPRIQALSKQKYEALFSQGNQIVIYEAPLLFEAKSNHAMDAIICVVAEDEQRINRIVNRDKVSREEAEKILLSQMPQEEKAARSQFVIKNDGDITKLGAASLEILNELKNN